MMDLRNRRRLQAALVIVIFVLPIVVMLALTTAGWAPGGHSYGQRIQPERNLADMPVTLAGGQPFHFANRKALWTVLALPGPDCGEACLRQLDLVHRAQIGLDQQSDHVRLVYLGAPPTGALAVGFDKVWTLAASPSRQLQDLRPTAPDSVSVVLVTPSGHAMLSYPSGFNPGLLQQDLRKAAKVVL